MAMAMTHDAGDHIDTERAAPNDDCEPVPAAAPYRHHWRDRAGVRSQRSTRAFGRPSRRRQRARRGRFTASATHPDHEPEPSFGAEASAFDMDHAREPSIPDRHIGVMPQPVFARIWGHSSASSAPSICAFRLHRKVPTKPQAGRRGTQAAAFLCARYAPVRACTPPVTARLRSRREPELSGTS